MLSTTSTSSITFSVDDVVPATVPLPECKSFEAVQALLDSPIESCGSWRREAFVATSFSEFLAGAIRSSGDMYWLATAHPARQHVEEMLARGR
jgi:hypothetical protein